MTLKQTLGDFRQFLFSVTNELPEWLKNNNEYMAEFYQANWEILVETRLIDLGITSGLIDIYGEGADSNGASSRVSLPSRLPKCSIQICEGFVFHSYGKMTKGYFEMGYPYEFVKGEHPDGREMVIAADDAEFLIGETYDNVAKGLS